MTTEHTNPAEKSEFHNKVTNWLDKNYPLGDVHISEKVSELFFNFENLDNNAIHEVILSLMLYKSKCEGDSSRDLEKEIPLSHTKIAQMIKRGREMFYSLLFIVPDLHKAVKTNEKERELLSNHCTGIRFELHGVVNHETGVVNPEFKEFLRQTLEKDGKGGL